MGKHVGHWGSYGLKQGSPLQKFRNHSQLTNIIILLSFFGSLSHHFKFRRVDIWSYWSFYGVIGEVLCGKVSVVEVDTAWNREIPCEIFKSLATTQYYYFIIIFLVYFLIVSRYTELICYYIEFFWSNRWVSLWIIVDRWGRYGLKRGNPLQNFEITNYYLILLFNHRFLVRFVIISRSTDLVFDNFEFFWGKRWGLSLF